jgi:hypothetical protein
MRINATALARATIGVTWLIVAMTLWAELSAPFKAYLAGLAGHHWVAKSFIAVAAFAILYFLFRKARESENILWNIVFAIVSVVLGGLIIFSFYLWHFLQI